MNGPNQSDICVRKNIGALKLLRSHSYDWILLVALAVFDGFLNIIHPYVRFVGRANIEGLTYPLKSDTVPVWAVPIIAVVFPALVTLCCFAFTKDRREFHGSVLGLLFSVALNAVITDAVKDGVGRARPDFFWRCFPDGNAVYNKSNGEVVCHGDPALIREGHKSFPSGHTSWCFAGMTFLSLYLFGKFTPVNHKGHFLPVVVVLLPLAVAVFVAISRVNDYRHHWQDVFVGFIIGSAMAILCYRQIYRNDNPYCMPHVNERKYAFDAPDLLDIEHGNCSSTQHTHEALVDC